MIDERPEDDFRRHIRCHYSIVWNRPPTEEDIDHVMDDVSMLPRVREFVQRFFRSSLPVPVDPCTIDKQIGDMSLDSSTDQETMQNPLAQYFELLFYKVDELIACLRTDKATEDTLEGQD